MELIYFPFYEENRTPEGGSDFPKIAEVESGKCFQLTFIDSLLDSDIGGGQGLAAGLTGWGRSLGEFRLCWSWDSSSERSLDRGLELHRGAGGGASGSRFPQ